MTSRNRVWNVRRNIGYYLLALVVAAGLKYHYSLARTSDLVWILYPTSQAVECISGLEFEPEQGEGYINRENGVVIAPSCSGVNFMIIAFCMAVFSFTHRFRDHGMKTAWFVGMIVWSYGITIGVNTFRILLAIRLYAEQIRFGWITPERLHRMEGVAVYFIFLYLFYSFLSWLSAGCFEKKRDGQLSLGIEKSGAHRSRAFVHTLSPLFWYFLVTIGVPVLNRAYLNNTVRFLEHCLVTIFISSSVLLIIYLVRIKVKR